MNNIRGKFATGVVVALLCACLLGLLSACGQETSSEPDSAASSDLLLVEAYELDFDAEFIEQAAGDVEVKRVTATTRSFIAQEQALVEFNNENMALMVPLSILNEAKDASASLVMNYSYSSEEGAGSIDFCLPTIPEYELYFPGASADEVSLLLADVALEEEQASSARERFAELGYEVEASAPVYSVMAYLVHSSNGENTAVKLESFNNSLTMVQVGSTTEESLESRLYLSYEDKVYKPSTVAFYENDGQEMSFAETYFAGSFITTQGSLASADYTDIQAHYSQAAIKQVQQSYNMAYSIAGDAAEFQPDSSATFEDFRNAAAAFTPVPLIDDASFAGMKEELALAYTSMPVFGSLEGKDENALLNNYQARSPYWTVTLFEELYESGVLDDVSSRGLVSTSRISVALDQIGSFYDLIALFENVDEFVEAPDSEEVEQWLLGINDVALDDPLRPYAALAVHYGLLTPDGEGNLNMYQQITRGDLCLSYANLSTLVSNTIDNDVRYDGFTQRYLYNKDSSLVFDVEGTWEFVSATRPDGSSYTQEEIDADAASFIFELGDSLELWTGAEYHGTYWFSLEQKKITVGYDYDVYYDPSRYESFEINDDLTELIYYYHNADDPEFDGEIYYFKRV